MTQLQTRIMRPREWSRPIPPVQREVISSRPHTATDRAARRCCSCPASATAPGRSRSTGSSTPPQRGFPAHAMSLRGHGASGSASESRRSARTRTTSSRSPPSLPQRAVLVGHGAGALVVAHALARYPARAGVLLAPVFGGWGTLGTALLRNPFGTVAGRVRRRGSRLRRGQLFGPNLHRRRRAPTCRRLGRRARRGPSGSCSSHRAPGGTGRRSAGAGGRHARTTRSSRRRRCGGWPPHYGGAPLLFPGMGHDMMLDAGWAEPIDAILDWLSKA